jgi:UDP-2-acetamido-2-deoxy-ribo-hexuluronate aminotransferase
VSLLGASPVFVDIDPRTFNIDPAQLDRAIQALQQDDPGLHPLPRAMVPGSAIRKAALTPRAIIAVDLFGLPADYARIHEVARAHGLLVIEDAAQSFGARLDGRMACALADPACTSFFPAKPLGAYGDGGMCFTDDDGMAQAMRSIRIHGQGEDKYDNVRLGINGRLDTLQAAVLLAKFHVFPEELELRSLVASRYDSLLAPHGSLVTPPCVPDGRQSAWAQYSVLAQDQRHRSALRSRLERAGFPTAIYYPKPLHLQPVYAHLGYSTGDFLVSEHASERIFSLPMHPYLEEDTQRLIVDTILSCPMQGRE